MHKHPEVREANLLQNQDAVGLAETTHRDANRTDIGGIVSEAVAKWKTGLRETFAVRREDVGAILGPTHAPSMARVISFLVASGAITAGCDWRDTALQVSGYLCAGSLGFLALAGITWLIFDMASVPEGHHRLRVNNLTGAYTEFQDGQLFRRIPFLQSTVMLEPGLPTKKQLVIAARETVPQDGDFTAEQPVNGVMAKIRWSVDRELVSLKKSYLKMGRDGKTEEKWSNMARDATLKAITNFIATTCPDATLEDLNRNIDWLNQSLQARQEISAFQDTFGYWIEVHVAAFENSDSVQKALDTVREKEISIQNAQHEAAALLVKTDAENEALLRRAQTALNAATLAGTQAAMYAMLPAGAPAEAYTALAYAGAIKDGAAALGQALAGGVAVNINSATTAPFRAPGDRDTSPDNFDPDGTRPTNPPGTI